MEGHRQPPPRVIARPCSDACSPNCDEADGAGHKADGIRKGEGGLEIGCGIGTGSEGEMESGGLSWSRKGGVEMRVEGGWGFQSGLEGRMEMESGFEMAHGDGGWKIVWWGRGWKGDEE